MILLRRLSGLLIGCSFAPWFCAHAEIDQAPEAKAEEAQAEESKAEEAKAEDEKPGEEAKEPENISLSDFVAQIKDPVIRRQLLLDLTKEDIENLNDE